MHATTRSNINVDDVVHQANPELCTKSEDEMAVWGYLMTQYNLKPEHRKLGEQGAMVAISELTQLHVMDTWTVMDSTGQNKGALITTISQGKTVQEDQGISLCEQGITKVVYSKGICGVAGSLQ